MKRLPYLLIAAIGIIAAAVILIVPNKPYSPELEAVIASSSRPEALRSLMEETTEGLSDEME